MKMKLPPFEAWYFALILALAVIFCGCATKTRNVEIDGMYVTDRGTLAIGSVDVMASPLGEESAMIRYEEDTAWLSPGVKTHEIKIMLTGTNAVASAEGIVESICKAFTTVAVTNGVSRCVIDGVRTDVSAENKEIIKAGGAAAGEIAGKIVEAAK